MVREAEHEDILDKLLPQVVVDAVKLLPGAAVRRRAVSDGRKRLAGRPRVLPWPGEAGWGAPQASHRLAEEGLELPLQSVGADAVVAEGLLDDHAPPPAAPGCAGRALRRRAEVGDVWHQPPPHDGRSLDESLRLRGVRGGVTFNHAGVRKVPWQNKRRSTAEEKWGPSGRARAPGRRGRTGGHMSSRPPRAPPPCPSGG